MREEERDSRIRPVDPEMPESKGERATESSEKRRDWHGRRATPLAGDQTPRRTVHGVTDEERLSNAPPTLPAREKHRLSKRAAVSALVSPGPRLFSKTPFEISKGTRLDCVCPCKSEWIYRQGTD